MRIDEVISLSVIEAETNTEYSKEISNTFKKAGYKQIGSGADSTIWDNDTGNVVKIIMPEEGGTGAVETFRKFVEFCIQHQELDCVPKFVNINGKVVQDFKVLDKDYQMVTMEKLLPLKKRSFEEGLVWLLSDYAAEQAPWDNVDTSLGLPSEWMYYNKKLGTSLADMYQSISMQGGDSYEKVKRLYNVMVFLYLRGKINKYGWDLHTANVMKRSNGDLVIIDPWYKINEGSN